MPYTKQTWIDNDTTRPLSAARLNAIEQGIADAYTAGPVLNLDNFYAGGTSDTVAFAALDAALANAGGGIAIIPARTYVINTTLGFTASNVTWLAWGATFTKTVASPYAFFKALNQPGKAGYGASIENWNWYGGTFRGSFDPANFINACAFAFHHVRNVLIERVTFVEMQGRGHTSDLNGCDGVTFRRCTFQGFAFANPSGTTGTERSEAINIDTSDNGALSSGDVVGTYDALPTINVLIDNCDFLPLTVTYSGATTTYPCPNPFGSHGAREGRYYENITMVGGRVIDPVQDLTTDLYRGVIHMPTVKGLKIKDVLFRQTTGRVSRVISVVTVTNNTTAGSDPNATTPTKATWAVPTACADVEITGCTFDGFAPPEGVTPQACIAIVGTATGVIDKVLIEGVFRNGYGTTTTPGDLAIYVNYAKNVVIGEATRVDTYNQGLLVSNSDTVDIRGHYVDIKSANAAYGLSSNNNTNFKVDITTLRQGRPMYVTGSHGRLAGVFNDVRSPASEGAMNITNVTNIAISSLTVVCSDTTHANAIAIYGTNSNVRIGTLVATGTTVRAAVSGTNTNVTGTEINTRTASYTLLGSDLDGQVELNVASANTLTVPTNATVPFLLGTVITLRQYGAGTTTVAGASGVTIRSRGGLLNLNGQYAEATLTKRGTDEWVLAGNLA